MRDERNRLCAEGLLVEKMPEYCGSGYERTWFCVANETAELEGVIGDACMREETDATRRFRAV